MQSSRDSSVWRSLAVAFGDGLAFGVGMKLSQTAARPATLPGAPNVAPIADRLAQIEDRVQKMEQTPALIAAPAAPPQRIDQQVLEAVVQAVETRLKEQAVHVERRFADLEARVTLELKSIHEEIRALAAGAETRIREVRAEAQQEAVTIRRDARESLAVAERRVAAVESALGRGIAAMAADLEQARTGFRHEIAGLGAAVAAAGEKAAAVEGALEARISAALEGSTEAAERRLLEEVREATGGIADAIIQATEATIDHRLAPLEATLAEKDSTIADLKAAARASERYVHQLLVTVGQMCQEAAQRFAPAEPAPAEPPRSPSPPSVSVTGPPDAAPPPLEPPSAERNGTIAARDAGPVELPPLSPEDESAGEAPAEAQPEALPGEEDEPVVPLFAQSKRPGRVWRIPLVSSFLMAGVCSLMLYYL